MMMKLCVLSVCVWVMLCGVVRAAEPVLPPLQEPLGGTLILHGGGTVSKDVKELFLKAAGGDGSPITVLSSGGDGDVTRKFHFGAGAAKTLTVLQAELNLAQAAEAVRKSTGVWIEIDARRQLNAYPNSDVERELRALLARGGVLACVGPGAELVSRRLTAEASPDSSAASTLKEGFGLLENISVAAGIEDEASVKRLSKVLEPPASGFAGLGIERGAAVVIVKRWMRVLDGSATVFYPASEKHASKALKLKTGDRADLLTIARAARERGDGRFPPKEAPIPEIPPKAMLVIGGSGISDEGVKRFVTHCGGVDARIVVIPTALDDVLNPAAFDALYEVKILKRIGVKNVTVVHAATRADAETADVLDPIRNATGVWFSGGRQWRLVDKYLGTSAEKEMHALLQRGGAIAGGSAGATIQGDYLVRGNPLGNVEMMVEGYERGLGFLKGVAVDQHFTQRKRFRDMTAFKTAVPHYLGIGIDENTALIVTGHVAEIVGEHVVSFYDRQQPIPAGAKDYTVVNSGESYDLKERKKIVRSGP